MFDRWQTLIASFDYINELEATTFIEGVNLAPQSV